MIRITYILLLLLATFNAKAQNLVPNGNFEQYSNCPTSLSQVNYCTGWRQYTTGTPDYFNGCSASNCSIPNNTFGYQPAASGNAYIGLYGHSDLGAAGIGKEYVATQISPLSIGALYEVSMSVSLSNKSKYGTDDLGVYFFDSIPSYVPVNGPLSVTPQISYSSYGPIIDTQNWVRVTQKFVASAAYDNIVIGGFKNSPVLGTAQPVGWSAAYYYIDSVIIRLVDSLGFSHNYTQLCPGDSIIIPFYVFGYAFSSNNIFALQLSDASGSFANPVTIGTFKGSGSGILKGVIPSNISTGIDFQLRIASTSPSRIATDPKRISIILDTIDRHHDTLVCADSFTLKGPSVNGASNFTWSTGDTTATINAVSSGIYWRSATVKCHTFVDTIHVKQYNNTTSRNHDILICKDTEVKLLPEKNCENYAWSTNDSTATVTVNTPGLYWCRSLRNCEIFLDTFVVGFKTLDVHVDFPADTFLCKNKDYQYTIGNDFGSELSYTWNTGEATCCIIPQSSGVYALTVSNGCESSSDTMEIKMINCEDCLLVPSAFTPNKDGLNDLFTVKSRCDLTSYTIRIFDRFGEQVFTSNSLEHRWDGNFKNIDMPLGTYFYVIHYQTVGSNYPNLRKGDITLVR